ncbi:hypothetical protein ACFY30_29475 [Streptomyces sp. NPDC000345]|uniref:hypothetical protein n=1 Tax=Streptomyces sp. NPDC000345 TaxID=3364537 RepID=UPI0036A24D9D
MGIDIILVIAAVISAAGSATGAYVGIRMLRQHSKAQAAPASPSEPDRSAPNPDRKTAGHAEPFTQEPEARRQADQSQ